MGLVLLAEGAGRRVGEPGADEPSGRALPTCPRVLPVLLPTRDPKRKKKTPGSPVRKPQIRANVCESFFSTLL